MHWLQAENIILLLCRSDNRTDNLVYKTDWILIDNIKTGSQFRMNTHVGQTVIKEEESAYISL